MLIGKSPGGAKGAADALKSDAAGQVELEKIVLRKKRLSPEAELPALTALLLNELPDVAQLTHRARSLLDQPAVNRHRGVPGQADGTTQQGTDNAGGQNIVVAKMAAVRPPVSQSAAMLTSSDAVRPPVSQPVAMATSPYAGRASVRADVAQVDKRVVTGTAELLPADSAAPESSVMATDRGEAVKSRSQPTGNETPALSLMVRSERQDEPAKQAAPAAPTRTPLQMAVTQAAATAPAASDPTLRIDYAFRRWGEGHSVRVEHKPGDAVVILQASDSQTRDALTRQWAQWPAHLPELQHRREEQEQRQQQASDAQDEDEETA